MLLWIMSDIHLESTVGWDLPSGDARPAFDVLVVAGDLIPRAERGVRWLAQRVPDRPVIFVGGNHEAYRQYGLIGTMDPNPELLKYINEALDNELQHHRMFPEFLEMGFTGDQFYHDGDEADFSQLQAEIETTNPNENPGALLLNFLTLISLGGADSENVRSEMRRFFEERCGPDSYAKMQAIEREFDDWRKSLGLDAGKTIAAILKHLGKFERTWIATGQDFPADGHFASERFTLQELEDHMSAKQAG